MMHFTPKKAFGALAALLITAVLLSTVSCAAMFNRKALTGVAILLPSDSDARYTRDNAEDFARFFDITLYRVKDGEKDGDPIIKEKVAGSTLISTLPGSYFAEVIAYNETKELNVGLGSSAQNGAFWGEEGYETGIFELKAGDTQKPVVINMNAVSDDEEPLFHLTFDPNGGNINLEETESGNHSETAVYSRLRDTVLPSDVTREHYHFGGWQLNGKTVEQKDITTALLYSNSDDGAITFLAKWNPIMHKVTYMDAGEIIKAEQFEEANGIELYVPTKPYFTFDRWYRDPELESFYISELTTEDVVLYAAWNKNIHTINFNSNGGTISPKPDSYFYEIDGYPELPVPTKDGYEFAGWYKDESFAADSKVTEIAVGTDQELTLFAKWVSTDNAGIDVSIGTDIPSDVDYYVSTVSGTPERYAVFQRYDELSSSGTLGFPCKWFKNGAFVRESTTTIIYASDLFEETDVGVFTITCVFTVNGKEYSATKTVTRTN